jgi:hypothetical protein
MMVIATVALWSDGLRCGRSSVVERNLAKVDVESSNLFARSNFSEVFILQKIMEN